MRRASFVLVCTCLLPTIGCGDDGTTTSSAGGAGTSTSGQGGDSATTTSASTTSAGGAGQGGDGGEGGAPIGCAGKGALEGDQDYTLPFGGDDRTYRVHAPPGYDGTEALPVVLVFHGYTETKDQIETITQMTPVTDERNAIVVYPQGRQNGWNAGTCCGSSSTLDIDDVGFAMAMLDEIEAAYCVDPKRIYSAGFSAGGMLSHRLACEKSERIAAIGPVSGTMAIDPCEPTRPVPVMHFHGTSDFIVAYDGGGFADAASVPDTIAGWVTRNGCEATATPTFDMGDAHCESYGGCDGDADVTLCTLEGGGHQWPGGESAGPGGTINMDIFASEAMLDFFEAHPLP